MNINELFWLIKNEDWEPDKNEDEQKVGKQIDDLLRKNLNKEVFFKADRLIVELTDIHEEMAFEKGFKTAVGLMAGSIKPLGNFDKGAK